MPKRRRYGDRTQPIGSQGKSRLGVEAEGEIDLLILGGEDHRTGGPAGFDRFERLERWMRDRIPDAGPVVARWSGQVYEPVDDLAFIGEDSLPEDAVDEQAMGDEAVDIGVSRGKLMIVVPAGTPDERLFDAATTLGGELVLEDGRRFSFEIKGDAIGAQFSATTAAMHEEPAVGLSALPDIPGGV